MRFALVGLAALAVGCAHGPPSRTTAAAPRWIELQSRHFTLRTDLPRRQARAALEDFEGVYSALETVAFHGDAPKERIDVVLFGDEASFQALAPPGAAGYFMPRQVDDPEPQPTIVIHGKMLIAGVLVEPTLRRFRHELTHRFVEHRLRWTPPWLEEGLAEYYSTLKLTGGDAIVGFFPNTKLIRVDIHTKGSLLATPREDRVELTAVPTVQQLLTADYATFHDRAHELPYYAGAWAFVHMMLNGPFGYAPRFTKFLELLAGGATPPAAWQECFWGVPLWRLENDFRRYVTRTEMDLRAISVALPRVKATEHVRELGADEVHLMLARIRPWDERGSIVAAGAELALARQLAGGHASGELHYWSGLYAARWRRFDDAERELRAAIALEPGRARDWLALAEIELRDERPETAARLDETVTHLAPLATSAQALDFVARYYSARGQIAAGLPYAERAVATERGCWECSETLAVLRNLARAPSRVSSSGGDGSPLAKPSID